MQTSQVPAFKKFTAETDKAKTARRKKWAIEAKEAEELLEEVGARRRQSINNSID